RPYRADVVARRARATDALRLFGDQGWNDRDGTHLGARTRARWYHRECGGTRADRGHRDVPQCRSKGQRTREGACRGHSGEATGPQRRCPAGCDVLLRSGQWLCDWPDALCLRRSERGHHRHLGYTSQEDGMNRIFLVSRSSLQLLVGVDTETDLAENTIGMVAVAAYPQQSLP